MAKKTKASEAKAGDFAALMEAFDAQAKRAKHFPDRKEALAWPTAKDLLDADTATQKSFIREMADRVDIVREKASKSMVDPEMRYANLVHDDGFPHAGAVVVAQMLRRNLNWTQSELAQVVATTAKIPAISFFSLSYVPLLLSAIEKAVG